MDDTKLHQRPLSVCDGQWQPLTFQQRYYLYLQQEGDGLNLLDGAAAFFLSGSLDVGALRRSIEDLIARHDSLRTRISIVDGAPRVRIIEPREYSLEVMHLPALPEDGSAGKENARHVAERLASKACQLQGGALFEAKLLRVTESEHVLLFGIHHLISDYLTRVFLLREIWILYGGILEGGGSPFAEPPPQFLSYHAWQIETYKSWLKEHESHWIHHLAGAAGIRWSKGKNEYQSGCSPVAQAAMSLSADVTVRLRSLAKRTNTLLSIVILAIYVALVARLCGQMDFVLATNTTGRDRIEFQHIAGFLAHPLYLRIRLTGHESFVDLLLVVSREYYRALLRKDFGGIVMDTPELSSATLFQWIPTFDEVKNGVPVEAEPSKINIKVEALSIAPAAFLDVWLTKRLNLMLLFRAENETITGTALYRPDVFPSQMINDIFGEFRALSEKFSEIPSERIATYVS